MVFLRRFDSGEYHAKGVPTDSSFGASSQEETSEASPTKQSRLQSLKEHHSRPPIRKHHKGSLQTLPQVVPLADFYPPQAGRVIQTHHRFVRAKQIFDSPKIQDGNSFHHQELPMCSPMGMQGRYKSGIPQRSNFLRSSGVHSFHHREGKETPNLRVSVPPVRSVVGPLGLPQNNKTNQEAPEGLDDLCGFIPGRLRVFRNNENGNAPSHTGVQSLNEKAQPVHQHVKVGFHPQTLHRVPGSAIQPKESFAFTPGKQDSFRSVREQIPYDSPCMLPEGFRIPNRAFKFRSRVHPARTSPSASSDQMDELSHLSPLSRLPRPNKRHAERVPRGLDIETLPLHVHPHAPPLPTMELMTDASTKGWCGVLLPHRTRELWPDYLSKRHINWLELKAVHLSLLHYQHILQGQTLLLWTDSSTALWCLRNQGSRTTDLMILTREILELCDSLDIYLIPRHLQGVLNVLADAGSRPHAIVTEWMLDRTSFERIANLPSIYPQVDLFATRDNRQLENFVSPCPDPDAVGKDAFLLDWNRWESIYLFPPRPVLARCLAKLASFVGTGVLVTDGIHYFAEGASIHMELRRRCRFDLRLPQGVLSQVTQDGVVFAPRSTLHAWIL